MNPFAHQLVGRSPSFSSVLRAAEIAAACDVGVLLLGESGTGKKTLARALHDASPRNGAPFVVVNCAALPGDQADAELFGGTTGITAAEGGTLLLDEVDALSPTVQAKLVHFLETGEYQAAGGTARQRADVRVIAATTADLAAAVAEGHFRDDLYYRLQVVPLQLPPLRARADDVAALAGHFTAELAARHGVEAPRFERDALKVMERCRWSGNLRELRNLCERMTVLHAGRAVDAAALPPELTRAPSAEPVTVRLPESGVKLEEVEVELIRQALDQTAGNRSRAARLLGITRDTLLYRLKKYALPA